MVVNDDNMKTLINKNKFRFTTIANQSRINLGFRFNLNNLLYSDSDFNLDLLNHSWNRNETEEVTQPVRNSVGTWLLLGPKDKNPYIRK